MGNKQTHLPHLIFLIFAPDMWENAEIMEYILANERQLGITCIYLTERIDLNLPLNCQVIIEVKDNKGSIRKDSLSLFNESMSYFHVDRLIGNQQKRLDG